MRVRCLLFLLIFSGSLFSFAQPPTLTSANVAPVVGDIFVIHNCVTNGVAPGPSGADTSWDFSNLVSLTGYGSADTARTATSNATEPAYLFPGCNTAILASPSSTVITYYMSGQAKLSQNGIYVNPTEYTVYSDPIDQLQFPFSFNNIFTDSFSAIISSGGSAGPVSSYGAVTTSADAYGTLTLPGAVGNVVYPNALRVHSIQSYTDSSLITGSLQTLSSETYTWYTPGYHNALLTIATITGTGGSTSMQVSYSARQLAGPESASTVQANVASFNLYPNPANNNLNIAYTTTGSDHVRISLFDVLGRQAAVITDGYTQGAQQLSYNVAALQKGLYIAKLESNTTTTTKQVVIQ